MKVKAIEGLKVPYENRTDLFIEQTPVEVEDSAYYQRRISDGDLILVEVENETVKQTKGDN